MMGYGYNMMGNAFGMMIIPLILIGLLIYVVSKKGQNDNVKEIGARYNSLDILSERFARGEINEDEYTHKRNILLGHKS